MKEDNNIKLLIASILKLSLKLSKCNESVKDCPKPKAKPKAKKVVTKKGTRARIVGGGSAEFFE
jgi:hypothetical protein